MILYEWRKIEPTRWKSPKDEPLYKEPVWQVSKTINGDDYLIATFATEEDAKAMMHALGRAIECRLG